MNAKTIGNNILSLRKKRGITQAELAQKLNISDKTVSKWENGQGYPDIAMLPALASIFGVTIDFLLLGEKKGIVIAGNIIADVVKNIDCFPKCGMMAHVSDVTPAVGGCVSNTAISLMSIDRSLNVSAIGKVGADDNGRYIISQMQKNGVKVDKIKLSEKSQTSFCDVMSLPSGERTFFHKKGANAEFSPKDVDVDALNCSIFHIGYILLLDEFDKEDKEYGTVMAGFLKKVQEKGIKTSIDVVSDSSADYGKKIIPALKYCNYANTPDDELNRAFNYWNKYQVYMNFNFGRA
ncbi:MAG: helix-turn-helix domain-containing protein, partial [Clostridia bacterium]|nr:helix-turn-helix domain-containing protein [Clostridia bacterium]